tara:strand:- start:671 stop:1888 length:1218 start_codon:yes stop_codon:yes gene_type:complete
MLATSVVDEIFARRETPLTLAGVATGAPPSAKPVQLTDLPVDQLAMIVTRALQVNDEPRGTFKPHSGLPSSKGTTSVKFDLSWITPLANLCNALRNVRLVNADLNRPALLEHTFEQISRHMQIDPVEVAHRVGEVNGDYLDRVRAVLRARCDFASKITRTHSTQEAMQEVTSAAASALFQSDVGGREDNFQTRAERMARCLWFCKQVNGNSMLYESARTLILAGWEDEVLTLANLSSPERVPPTVTLKALEHLLQEKAKPTAADILYYYYEKLLLLAAKMNRPSAVEVLLANAPHTLSREALPRALAHAVEHSSGRMVVALASRDALASDVYPWPAYVEPVDMMMAYSVARSEEQKRLLYLPSLDEAPNIFYDPRASPQQLAAWKQRWRRKTDLGLEQATKHILI